MNSKFKKIALFAFCSAIAMSAALYGCAGSDVDVNKTGSLGYEKSVGNELYSYDVFSDHIVLTGYKGEEETVIIPETIDEKTVTVISSGTFRDISGKVKSVRIPNTVTTIEIGSFTGNSLESIEINADNPLFEIENGALTNKDKTVLLAFPGKSDIEEFTVPDTVSVVPAGVFSGCKNLKKITVPSSVKEIATFAFMASGITQMELPEGVERIGMGVFWNCTSLETLTLPKSLKTIDNPETTCQSCTALKTVKGYDSTDAAKIVECEGLNAKYESLGE